MIRLVSPIDSPMSLPLMGDLDNGLGEFIQPLYAGSLRSRPSVHALNVEPFVFEQKVELAPEISDLPAFTAATPLDQVCRR